MTAKVSPMLVKLKSLSHLQTLPMSNGIIE